MFKNPWDIFILLKVLRDLEGFLPHLILVGGWVPYLYSRYLWGGIPQEPITTTDIDFGFAENPYSGKETITARIVKKEYGQHHVRIMHDFPFVPIAQDKAKGTKFDVEFITSPHTSQDVKNRLIGHGILINEIKFFDVLLEKTTELNFEGIKVIVPTPASYVFHKLLTFSERRGMKKRKKDLYYAYYVLLAIPDREDLKSDVRRLIQSHSEGRRVRKILASHFKDVNSQGPIFIDEIVRDTDLSTVISDIRKDAFERINELIN